MRDYSIKLKLFFIVIGIVVSLSVIGAVSSIYSINKLTKQNIDKYKQEAYKAKEIELKNYVSVAIKSIESYYERTSKQKIKEEVEKYIEEQSGFMFSMINDLYEKYHTTMDETELKTMIKGVVKSSRYGKSGYFWINDFDYNMVMHPIKKNLTGQNFKDSQKVSFVGLGVDALNKSQKDTAYIQYSFYNPSSKKRVFKSSIVKVFKPYGWIIGTGAYIDDLTQRLQKEALKTVAKMKYGKSGYFWINDHQYNMVMHPIKKNLTGQNFKGSKNVSFVGLGIDALNKTAKDTAYIKYSFYNPKNKITQAKLSIVQKFKPWGWIIGTGAYVDEIENKINDMKKNAKEEINNIILNTVLSSLVLAIIIMSVVYIVVNKTIIAPLENFQVGLLNFFKYLNKETSQVELLDISKDEIGTMSKVVNENINKTKSLIDQDESLINDVKRVVLLVKDGNLKSKIEKSTQNESLEELKTIINEMLNVISKNVCDNIIELQNAIESYQNLDFTKKLDNTDGKTAQGLNSLIDIINKMLVENKVNGLTLENSSNTLLSNVKQLSASSSHAAASLEETAASLEQITTNITQNTHNIVQMSNYASELTTSASQGQMLANQTTKAMDEINEQVSSINEAIAVIDQIAFQTNILSLNAAVEAATAGEAGKGFAVVAQEVRNLASRSAQAANDIKNIVQNANIKANDGKVITDKMIEGYGNLNENISKTLELISDIESSSKEQQTGIEQINSAVTLLDQETQQNADVAHKTQQIAIQTKDIAYTIVQDANEKKFIGKESAKAKDI